jgi:lipoate-protein ligase A
MSDREWYLLEEGRQPAAYNMALDEALLESAPELGRPVLRFYGWTEPAATFGYSQKYSDIARWTRLRPLLRRPTGGGLVPHNADWTYSVAIPPRHGWYQLRAQESYQRVHEWVRDALARIGIMASLAPVAQKEMPGQCFIGAEKSDVLWHGRKIAGAAQRRTRNGLLVQGSVQPPPVPVDRARWQSAMRAVACEQWQVEWSELKVEGKLAQITAALAAAKYSQSSYNQKR